MKEKILNLFGIKKIKNYNNYDFQKIIKQLSELKEINDDKEIIKNYTVKEIYNYLEQYGGFFSENSITYELNTSKLFLNLLFTVITLVLLKIILLKMLPQLNFGFILFFSLFYLIPPLIFLIKENTILKCHLNLLKMININFNKTNNYLLRNSNISSDIMFNSNFNKVKVEKWIKL